jgi:hypothetical protein
MMNWLWLAATVLVLGYFAWFLLGGRKVGTVRGNYVGPWGRTMTARIVVRSGGERVRFATIGAGSLAQGEWLSRVEALQLADALDKAAHEAVS